jgi:immune inhibitor A
MNKLVVLLILFSSVCIYGQMPPHPDLVEKIKSGLIETPSVLKNIEEYRDKGIDAAWRDENLSKVQPNQLTSNRRNFGAMNVPSGDWNALAILVEFSDNASITTSTFFDDLMFEQTAGTMWDYFSKVSYGNLDIVTVNLPSSLNWVSAPSTYEYYAGGDYGMGSYPQNARKLVEDVVQLVDHLVDYSQYDNDNDGDVDALMIVHSGPGAEYTGEVNDIWSHMWSTKNPPRLDGVWITRYSIQPEYFNNSGDMTIGVYCHELGHLAFGLPDLYDTDYSSNGLGRWSLMAGGSWNGNSGDSPAFPDAYNHIQMGYVDPTIISANTISQTISQVETNAEIYKIYPNNNPGNEYFLVENRQLIGYDSYLRQGGLHIYHVDESVNTQNENEWYPGNTKSGHYMVALEQADGLWDLEKNENSDRGDVYPGNTNNRTFDYNSTPDSRKYNGADSEISIVNISNSQTMMTADFELFESLTLTSPNGGENWQTGTAQDITWTSVKIDNISIEYSTDNGSNWITVESSYPASGQSYSWAVPDNSSGQCLVKISDSNDSDPFDQSDNVFTIFPDHGQLYTITGNVIYNRTFYPIENASVSLYQGVDLINTTVSGVDGSYAFIDVAPGSYSVRVEKSDGWGTCLASDALEVALYSVNPHSTYLPDELSKVAGWVTLLGTEPSAADALSILNRSVSIITEFTIPDWLFEEVDISVVSSDEQADIKGICAGDAKSDYNPTGIQTKSSYVEIK